MAKLYRLSRTTQVDTNGDAYAGGLLNFYKTGTTTRLDTYSDNALSSANSNPVAADSAGRFGAIYLKPEDYKVVFTDSDSSTVWTEDPEHGSIAASDSSQATNDLLQFDGTNWVPKTPDEAGLIKQGLHTQYFPVDVMYPSVSAGCSALTSAETTANRPVMRVLDFDGTSDEHCQWSWAFPKMWDEGTITYRYHWTTGDTGVLGVAMYLQALAVANDDNLDTAFGTAVINRDKATGSATGEDLMVSPTSGAVTIGGSPAAGELVFFDLYRDVSDTGDTMSADDMRLLGVEIFYTINDGDDA